MAYTGAMASSDALPSRGFKLSRDNAVAAASYDPCAGIEFYPAVGSDELFEALKLAFPRGKNNKARMREAIIEFLISEREAERSRSQSPEITRNDQRPLGDTCQDTDRVAPKSGKPSPISLSPASYADNTKTEAPLKRVGDTATEIGNAKPHTDSVSKSTFHELTIVWNSVDGMAQKPRAKRSMTEKELERYRLRRALGACRVCKAKKRKCNHNSPQSSTDDEERQITQCSDTSNNSPHSAEDDVHSQKEIQNHPPKFSPPEPAVSIFGDNSYLQRKNHAESEKCSTDNQHADEADYHPYHQPEPDDFDELVGLAQTDRDLQQFPVQDLAPLESWDSFLSAYNDNISTFNVCDFANSLSWTHQDTPTLLSWPYEDTNRHMQSAPIEAVSPKPPPFDFPPTTLLPPVSLSGDAGVSLSRSSTPLESFAAAPASRRRLRHSVGRQAAPQKSQQQPQPLEKPDRDAAVQRGRRSVSIGFSNGWLQKVKDVGQKLTKGKKNTEDETTSKLGAYKPTNPTATNIHGRTYQRNASVNKKTSSSGTIRSPASLATNSVNSLRPFDVHSLHPVELTGEAPKYCQFCHNKLESNPWSSHSYSASTWCQYCANNLEPTDSPSYPGSGFHAPPRMYSSSLAADYSPTTSYVSDVRTTYNCISTTIRETQTEQAAHPTGAAPASASLGSEVGSGKQPESGHFPAYELELSSVLGATHFSRF